MRQQLQLLVKCETRAFGALASSNVLSANLQLTKMKLSMLIVSLTIVENIMVYGGFPCKLGIAALSCFRMTNITENSAALRHI